MSQDNTVLIYQDNELGREATNKNFLLVRNEGTRQVKRNIDHYNFADIYIKLFWNDELTGLNTIAEKEIEMNRNNVFRHKLILTPYVVVCSGDAAKFFLPPAMGQ